MTNAENIKSPYDIVLFFSGINSNNIEKYSEKIVNLHFSAGLCIICVSVMGWFSMYFAMSTGGYFLSNWPQLLIVVPALWAIIIFAFDRAIVVASVSEDPWKFKWGLVISWLFIAIIIAFSISLPFEQRFFNREIEELVETKLISSSKQHSDRLREISELEWKLKKSEHDALVYNINREMCSILDNINSIKSMEILKLPLSCREYKISYCYQRYESNYEMPVDCREIVSGYSDYRKGAKVRWERFNRERLQFGDDCKRDKVEQVLDPLYIESIEKLRKLEGRKLYISDFNKIKMDPKKVIKVISISEAPTNIKILCASEGVICPVIEEGIVYYSIDKIGFF